MAIKPLKHFSLIGVSSISFMAFNANALEADIGAELASDNRYFTSHSPIFQGPRFDPSFVFDLDIELETPDQNSKFKVSPFVRLNFEDNNRSHFDLREAYWRLFRDDWDVLIGFNQVFWGVTESRHLVNVINQIDILEDVDGEDYLGQPMVSFTLYKNWGVFSLSVLPQFRPVDLPTTGHHLSISLPTGENREENGQKLDKNKFELALRYTHTIGDMDLGLSYFHGIGREPKMIIDEVGHKIHPTYSMIDQVGTDIQITKGAMIWKLESIYRSGQGTSFVAGVAGFEYLFPSIFSTSLDISFLGEYLFDDRDLTAPETHFQNDGFLGLRLAFNDTQDTTLLAGVVSDIDDGSRFYRVEFNRRLNDTFSLQLESQIFSNVKDNNSLINFKRDSFINLSLRSFF